MEIDLTLTPQKLKRQCEQLFELSAAKIRLLETWGQNGSPVFTWKGVYVSRGWTEWTQGFQFGSAFLQFDATGKREFLELAKRNTVEKMASHVSHIGVHDHGFNNISTYGNWWRLIREGRIDFTEGDKNFCEMALKVSGAVQAARWSKTHEGGGYIYSFNGPHSLFIDTIRSLRSLAVAHQLGHTLMGECDEKISLLDRLVKHGEATAKYGVYYGAGRDAYDLKGRTAHESIFNMNDGRFRCPSSQQGYSPFSTWTRGLAWAICGFTEQLEFFRAQRVAAEVIQTFKSAAIATAEFYIQESCADGIPMWDTGAPNLHRLGAYKAAPGDPFNKWEPVDSSAAAIAAQGLIRLGDYLDDAKYRAAGLTIARALFKEPYLSTNPDHQGLLLHSVYHRPNGWDYVREGESVPNGESSMWGDYHARELALLILRWSEGRYLQFFAPTPP